MKILVCGGRDYDDYETLRKELDLCRSIYGSFTVISGCARGADSLAIRYAKEHNDPVELFIPDWKRLGRSAGIIRNKEMLTEGKPDIVLAFPGGKGTFNMKMIARKAGVPVIEVSDES